jgi:hypothetical protein
MLIVGLGDHDMILGRKWFAETGVLIDCKNRCLIWPEGVPQGKEWGRILTTTKENLEPAMANPRHQEDADRRDRAMAKEMAATPRTILRRPASSPPSTWKEEQAEQYRKMREELGGRVLQSKEAGPRRPVQENKKPRGPAIDICGITAAAFRVNLRRKENVLFATSMYEIDRELETREPIASEEGEVPAGTRRPDESELQWLKRILPEEFRGHADVFSQEASNELPPHRSYDHTVKIEDPRGPESIGYSPLRQHSTHELQEMKRFLEENLQRGFVTIT